MFHLFLKVLPFILQCVSDGQSKRLKADLGIGPQAADGRHGYKAEALVQVLVGGASLQQSKGDEIELTFENQHQLPVPAYWPTGVHQTLREAEMDRQSVMEKESENEYLIANKMARIHR